MPEVSAQVGSVDGRVEHQLGVDAGVDRDLWRLDRRVVVLFPCRQVEGTIDLTHTVAIKKVLKFRYFNS
jgi:hypothetical protein